MSLLSTAAGKATEVYSTTGVFTAVGIWTALASVLIAYIKWGPRWGEQRAHAKRDAAEQMGARIDKLERDVGIAQSAAVAADERAHRAEMSMSHLIAVVQILMSEVDKLDPGNRVLPQAREMLAAAVTGDLGINAAMKRLASVAGTGERE